MTTALRVITGGRMPPPPIGGGGGGWAGGLPPRRRRRRGKHWLADALFSACATYPRTGDINEIHRRVCRYMRMPLSSIPIGRIYGAIYSVRDDPVFYQWDICHVAKGTGEENRRYFPVLLDYDMLDDDGEPYAVWDPDDYEYAKWGAVSSARTVATMLRHEVQAFDALIPMAPPEDRRRLRIFQAQLGVAQAAAEQAARSARAMV